LAEPAERGSFGVTPDGFVLKGIDSIVAGQQARAREMFGDDVDLTSGSALRKVMDAVAWDAQELWRSLESQYYANFVTTASGASLELLGTDLGLPRRLLQATGQVLLTLSNGAPGRRYVLPEGTVVTTVGPPLLAFRTVAPVTVDAAAPAVAVGVRAAARGPAGNRPPQQALRIDPGWAALHLTLGPATVVPTNSGAFSGGELAEPDGDYRPRLLGLPRTLWTPDAVLAQVLDLDGVRDAALFDPLGGVDVSQSYFSMFVFGSRAFALPRQVGSPYYFDVVVATEPGWPWHTDGGPVPGVYDSVIDAVRQTRPASIFPNVIQADVVDVGVRATLLVLAGHDQDAIRGKLLEALHASVDRLRLGRGVLYSDVLLTARTAAGVIDVQNLHLRRCPPAFDGIAFGDPVFGQTVELAVGENLTLQPREVAQFSIDSELIDIEVVAP
jgi:baseplate J-like protein